MTNGGTQKARVFTKGFIILSCINFFMFFAFQMLNVGMPVYVASLGANAVLVGLSTTLVTIMALAIRPFSGIILDRFGRKGIMAFGLVFIICATVAYAVFPIVGVILGFRLLHGIGWGLGSTACSTIAADIIPRERFAEGMGYFAMTNSISSALAPALAVHLTESGSALTMLFVAIGMTLVALLFTFVFKEKSQQVVKRISGEQLKAQSGTRASGKDDAPVHADPSAACDAHASAPQAYRGIEKFFERKALFPSCIMALVNISFACITTFIALHGASQGVNGVSVYFIVYALVTIVTRPLVGKIIDARGFFWPGVFSTLCTVATCVLIGFSTTLWMFALGGLLAGLGIGTAMGNFQTMAVGAVPPQRRGVATSTYFFAFDCGIAVGSLVGGALVAACGYAHMYVIVSAAPLLACVLFLAMGKRRIDAYS